MIETLDLKTTIDIDDHVRYVEKAFDLKVDSEMTTRIPLHHRLKESFENIGVIYGASGQRQVPRSCECLELKSSTSLTKKKH